MRFNGCGSGCTQPSTHYSHVVATLLLAGCRALSISHGALAYPLVYDTIAWLTGHWLLACRVGLQLADNCCNTQRHHETCPCVSHQPVNLHALPCPEDTPLASTESVLSASQWPLPLVTTPWDLCHGIYAMGAHVGECGQLCFTHQPASIPRKKPAVAE